MNLNLSIRSCRVTAKYSHTHEGDIVRRPLSSGKLALRVEGLCDEASLIQ